MDRVARQSDAEATNISTRQRRFIRRRRDKSVDDYYCKLRARASRPRILFTHDPASPAAEGENNIAPNIPSVKPISYNIRLKTQPRHHDRTFGPCRRHLSPPPGHLALGSGKGRYGRQRSATVIFGGQVSGKGQMPLQHAIRINAVTISLVKIG